MQADNDEKQSENLSEREDRSFGWLGGWIGLVVHREVTRSHGYKQHYDIYTLRIKHVLNYEGDGCFFANERALFITAARASRSISIESP